MFEVSKTGIGTNLDTQFPSMKESEVAKESLGLCHCCLAEGMRRDMTFEYVWMNECEVYADMLLKTFDIKISTDDQTGMKHFICETCISRLREASNFKKQVIDSEKQFISMLRIGGLKSNWQPSQLNIKLEVEENDNIDIEETNLDDFNLGDVEETLNCKEEQDFSCPDEYTIADTTIGQPSQFSIKFEVEENDDVDIEDTNLEDFNLGDVVRVPEKIRKVEVPPSKGTKHNLQTILKYSNVTPFIDKTFAGYVCGYCKNTFPDPQDLRSHTAADHRTKRMEYKFPTNICDYNFRLDVTDLMCTACNKDMKNLNVLKNHLVKTHQQNIFDVRVNYLLEFRLKEGEQYDCALCTSSFETFKMLKQHMNKHYPNFVCDECSSTFVTKRSILKHKRTHKEGSFECTHCDKIFKTNVRRLYHEKMTHIGRKINNNCAYCDLKFENQYKRNLHLQNVHEVDPMYKCNICKRKYLTKFSLTRHNKRDHLLERNHKCKECGYSCYGRRELLNHMLKHSGERNYVCDICKKAFGRKSTLREHMRIHINDRRFKCKECGVMFVQKHSLRFHLSRTHDINLAMREITCSKSE